MPIPPATSATSWPVRSAARQRSSSLRGRLRLWDPTPFGASGALRGAAPTFSHPAAGHVVTANHRTRATHPHVLPASTSLPTGPGGCCSSHRGAPPVTTWGTCAACSSINAPCGRWILEEVIRRTRAEELRPTSTWMARWRSWRSECRGRPGPGCAAAIFYSFIRSFTGTRSCEARSVTTSAPPTSSSPQPGGAAHRAISSPTPVAMVQRAGRARPARRSGDGRRGESCCAGATVMTRLFTVLGSADPAGTIRSGTARHEAVLNIGPFEAGGDNTSPWRWEGSHWPTPMPWAWGLPPGW